MAKKFDFITELYEEAVKSVAETPENWMSFLKSACRSYRLPFDEQLLIHAQHPDAQAVFSMEDWNKKFGRWVKRDAGGIAVFDKNAGSMRLKYYFDISDTKEGRYRRLLRPVPLWEAREEYRQEMRETLARAYGVPRETACLEAAIMEAAKNMVDDRQADYMQDILSSRKDGFLGEMDECSAELQAKRLLSNSTAYMVMARCGMDAETYLNKDDFQGITAFNTPEFVNLLGTAVSEASKTMLGEISGVIQKLQKEEKEKSRTFAGAGGETYNEGIKENSTLERRPAYEENQLQQAGGLPSAGFKSAGRGGSTPWEVRIAPADIPEGMPLRDIHKPADAGKTERASDADTERGTGENGADNGGNGRGTEPDGGAESRRPDGLDWEDEQYPAGSGGGRDEGTDIQLTFPETGPQTEDGRQAEEAPAARLDWHDGSSVDWSLPFFGKDRDIKSLLLSAPSLKATKREIREFYETHEDKWERTEYIRGIFNNESTEVTLEDGRRAGYKTYQNVLHMWEGSSLSRTAQAFYDWDMIAQYFEGMRLLGELRDRAEPLPTVNGQLSFMEHLAGEKPPAFSFSQEIVDAVIRSGSRMEHGKYRIYAYFKNHTDKEKADFLKKEYGIVGACPVIAGTEIDMFADGRGIRIAGNGEELLLSWGKAAKRIGELIAAGRYMTGRELEYLPEYEKSLLTAEIYHFYQNQPEETARPYPQGSDYHAGVKAIRPQIENPERVEEILAGMKEALDNTAEHDRHYKFMKKAYRDLMDYRDGAYGLPAPAPSGQKDAQASGLPEPGGGEALAQEEKKLPDMETPYDIHVDTLVYIGTKEYRIDFLSDERTLLRDMDFPLLTEEMPREEFERKMRENPANDHLRGRRPLPEAPAGKKDEETPAELSGREEIQSGLSIKQRNYQALMELAGEVLLGKKEFMSFEAGASFMPLSVELIGEGRIAVSHYFTQNGDLLADPDMEFAFDNKAGTLTARTYRQDTLNRFERVEEDGAVNGELEEELNQFAGGWFHNIREQGYKQAVPQRFEAEQTSDAFPEPYAVLDTQAGKYYEEDGAVQTFETEEEAERYADRLNKRTQEPEREEKAGQKPEKEGEAAQAGLVPAWEKTEPPGRPQAHDLHPEIPQEKRNQYRITDKELGYGTQKEKFRANIMAIQLLKKCEEEDRLAGPDEQEILSKYVGWGGLADAFDETKSAWSSEYMELKTVLTPEEYEAARQSVLTAFYTPPIVIRAVYQILENMGLKAGNILEPSCGIGNFIGMKPESLSDCRVYGVEADSISGRIAGQLYQKSAIAVQGYEEAALPDSFFDAAVGNVPFGQFRLPDKRYDRHKFFVHDYFFAKTLDKVRPGGVIAFITSSGTMDKKNPSIRKYIAQRAELLGAVRLPNDTFKKNAGTEVTSDILFLQKRGRMIETEPDWLYLDTDKNGIVLNRYFVEHPEMVLGEMAMESTQYGMDSTCRPYKDASLESLLAGAVENIRAEITEYGADELEEEEDNSIPADPSAANFSYTVMDGKIYYRENSRMKPVELSTAGIERVKGMAAIRDCVRGLIAYQTEGYADRVIKEQQEKLNRLYDAFQKKYGLLNARANSLVFSDDSSYPLLCSLEVLAEDGTLERKADMFSRRTIKPHQAVTKVDTASEALSLSLSEKACVDMGYMCSLTGKSAGELEQDLKGVIFRLPDATGAEPEFVSEDEYLSGNVRKKLKEARLAAQSDAAYESNVKALERVQPKDLTASEISVRLGATWIPPGDVEAFMFELLNTPNYSRWNIKVHFSEHTGEWNVEGKNKDRGNVKANNAYGTHRANAYKIIEDSLNLRDTRIYDYEVDGEGKKKAVLNRKETAIAQGKQDLIKQAFCEWIWQEPERRQRLTEYYNEKFNAVRPREYDGSHLHFYGMNPEIQLRQHQKNGAARIIYGGNSLLAYVVGAGKTYTMAAAAMECRRLGLCSKSMVVVPNHIIEQFAAEWFQLYPVANLLVATKKDFEKKNRKKFCARIATSDIDAVIIGHSQFEKIPLSAERQQKMLKQKIQETVDGIREAKKSRGGRFTVKQLEKSKKSLEARLKKLNDQSRKDDVVAFEELGIDRLFVDEADSYKNLYLYTKMRNVGGIAQTEAQKSSDMFMKCRYLDEITGGKGVVFATGTPVSNSMVELYTMQRYLQYDTLAENHLQHFDAWASTFGETVTAIDIACQL